MSRAVEELVEELIEMEKKEQAIEFALHLLRDKICSSEKIAQYTKLSFQKVQTLANQYGL